MNCYYHSDKPAVGICKHCSKGVCRACAIDEGYGIACKDRHETVVKAIEGLIQTNINATKDAGKNMWVGPIFSVLFGSIFIGYGLNNSQSSNHDLLLILGGVMMAFGLQCAWRSYRIFGRKQ